MTKRLVCVARATVMLVVSVIVAEAAQRHLSLTDHVVMAEVERRKAELVARGLFGVLSVDNKRRLERER